jgi:protein-S-isoprenylcysteine O-methyltransferase Ste14
LLLLLIWAGLAIIVATIARLTARRLLADVWPAYLFALPVASRLLTLGRTLTSQEIGSIHQLAFVVQELAGITFLSVVVALFTVRVSPTGPRTTPMQAVVALLGTFILNAAAFVRADSSASTDILIASSALVIAGTLFAIWSLAALGRCFGIFPEVPGLVIRGPYRLVRHPVYVGGIVAAAGILLVKPHPLTLAVLGTLVGLQYWRTLFEERALVAAFPTDYTTYRARVPRLIPILPRFPEPLLNPISANDRRSLYRRVR